MVFLANPLLQNLTCCHDNCIVAIVDSCKKEISQGVSGFSCMLVCMHFCMLFCFSPTWAIRQTVSPAEIILDKIQFCFSAPHPKGNESDFFFRRFICAL